MSAKKKSQKGFVAVTLITLLAIALVLVVYATLLGTFTGGDVVVVAVEGNVQYSLDNSTGWTSSISNLPITDPWYARFNLTSTDGYQGNATITWMLYKNTTSFYNVTTNDFNLTGNAQIIYASSDGLVATNYNWGQNSTVADTYRVDVKVETA